MERPGVVTRAVQRFVIRTGRGPLGRVWGLGYRIAARLAAVYLLRGERDPSVYARSGTGGDETTPGISDIDLAFVVATDPAGPGVAAYRLRERYDRWVARWPLVGRLVDRPGAFDEEQLADVAGRTYLTYGLDEASAGRASERADLGIYGRRRLLERPGLDAEPETWLHLRGPDRRPAPYVRDDQEERIAAWLELWHLWRLAFELAPSPDRPYAASLCVKLVADPARLWLWLTERERVRSRGEALEGLAELLPEERETARDALELAAALDRMPAAPIDRTFATLVRLSARIADEVSRQAFAPGVREVRLVGTDAAERAVSVELGIIGDMRRDETAAFDLAALRETEWPAGTRPLCDWLALAVPTWVDACLVPLDGDPAVAADLVAAAARREGPFHPALRRDQLLVLPTTLGIERPMARRLGCRASDPVAFAVLDADPVARFPEVKGWSVADTARRAVAEQRERLLAGPRLEGRRGAAFLLAAARAAILHDSLRDGEPVLPVTVVATARLLGERVPAARAVADAAGESLLAGSPPPSPAAVSALREVVGALPAFATT